MLKVWKALICSLALNHTAPTLNHALSMSLSQERVGESSQMALDVLEVFWAPAASSGGVGWVYIPPTPKTSRWRSETSRYWLYRPGTAALSPALPGSGTAARQSGTAAAPWDSTGDLTKNAITFYSELRFQWSWTFRKACFEGYPTLQRTSPRSTSEGAVLSVFSHVSTRVRLVWALETCLWFVMHPPW